MTTHQDGPHVVSLAKKLTLCLILLTINAIAHGVSTSNTERLIDHTISIQRGRSIDIYDTTENVIYGIDTEQYFKEIKYLEQKVNLIVDSLPQQSLAKHIIQFSSNEAIIIYKTFVSEQECENLCENAEMKAYGIQVAKKLSNMPENCKQLNVQMSLIRNKWGVICTEKNETAMSSKCFNKIKQTARKLNLMFYGSLSELENIMEYNKVYNLVQNSTHFFISTEISCCSCFGNQIAKEKNNLVGIIYEAHRSKMKEAAENRLARIKTDAKILESLLESLMYRNYDTEGILDITNKEMLIQELKNSYFEFVKAKKGNILLEQDILYPDLIDIWNKIKLNNTDEQFYQDLRKIEYEKLKPVYLSYFVKIFEGANQKLLKHIQAFTTSTNQASNIKFPILYKQSTKLEDIVFQIEKHTNKISSYAVKEFLKLFEFVKLEVAQSIRRLTGIYITNTHYASKKPPRNLEDSIEYLNNEISPSISMQDSAYIGNESPEINNSDPRKVEPEILDLLHKYLEDTHRNIPEDYRQSTSRDNHRSTKQNRNRQKQNKKRNRRTTTISPPLPPRYSTQSTHTNWAEKPLRDTITAEEYAQSNTQEFNQVPSHTFLLSRLEYDTINQMNLSAYNTPTVIAEQIPPTNYIYIRMKNRDKNKDGYLDLSELHNYESLMNTLGYYSEGIMNYLITYYGITKPGSLTISEFYYLSKILEKVLKSKTQHNNKERNTAATESIKIQRTPTSTNRNVYSTEQKTYATSTPEQRTPKTNQPQYITPTTLPRTTSTTRTTTTIHTNPTTKSSTKINTDPTHKNPTTDTIYENPNRLRSLTTTAGTTTSTSIHLQNTPSINDLLENEHFDTLPKNYEPFERNKRSILKQLYRYEKYMETMRDSKMFPYLNHPRAAPTPAARPEINTKIKTMKSYKSPRKKRSANVLTPWYAYWTGLASQNSIESISKEEDTIKENEEIVRTRIVNLTTSDDIFRKEIKNITVHISNLLGQSSNLSESFLKMLGEETDIEEKISFVIKSLGQVVHLSIQVENLLFHLTSLQGEITTHLANINNIQTGTSILNEDLFQQITTHGTKLTPATYNNVEYSVFFQEGVYQIKAKYKLLFQTFTEYRILSLPYVMGRNGGQISIVKLDVQPTIIMNDEREVIHPDELKTCEIYKSNFLCNVKNIKFQRQRDTCEADIISKLIYGKPSDLSLCKDKLMYVKNIMNNQEYRQTKYYVLILSDFADVAHWKCRNATEDTHIEPFKIIFIKIIPNCILETARYRIYIQKVEDLVDINPEFIYDHDDLVNEMLIPMLKEYNFTEGLKEISENILHASMNLNEERKSLSTLTTEQGNLHANDLGRLLLKPWTIQKKTTSASTASVLTILIIASIFVIGILICCCYCCTMILPIWKCFCIPFKACRTYAKTRNKQAVYTELRKRQKDFKQRIKNKDMLENWIKNNGEHILSSDILYDPTWDKFTYKQSKGEPYYFDFNDIYAKTDVGLREVGKMDKVPIHQRNQLRNHMADFYKKEAQREHKKRTNKNQPSKHFTNKPAEHRINRTTNTFEREPTYSGFP